MTLQTGKQTTAIEILPHISRSNGNQTMKFGQVREYNARNIFQKSCRNETWRLVPNFILLKYKQVVSSLVSNV